MRQWKNVLLGALVVGILVSCAPSATPTPQPDRKLKVALVHYGTFTDKGWGQQAYEGFTRAVEEFGLESAVNEMLPSAEWEATFREYGAKGYDLVVATAGSMDDVVETVAAEYPDTFYLVDAGRKANGKNTATISSAQWQEGHLAGSLAAFLTKSKKIGFIGGMDVPTISIVEDAAVIAAAEIDASIEVMGSYVGSWTDVQKGKELANALIDAGADVIVPKADAGSLGAISACEERGVLVAATTSDLTEVGPNSVVGGSLLRNDAVVYEGMKLFVEGKLEPKVYTWGAAEGVVDWVWNPALKDDYPDLVTLMDEVMADLKSGKVQAPPMQ